MPIMVWEPSLDIGVPDMNREHIDILNAMNAIYDAVEAGKSGPGVMAMIDKLGAITTRHFKDEEAFMTKIGFPDLENHKRMHEKLLKGFAEHADAARAAGGRPKADFFQFLRLWLSAHIKHIDRTYATHAQKQTKTR